MPSDDDPIFKSRKKADAKNRKDNHQMSHQFSSLENLNDILKKLLGNFIPYYRK